MKGLGAKIKEFRLDRQMTQVQVSVLFDVGINTIVRLEQGREVTDLIRAKIEKKLREEGVAA